MPHDHEYAICPYCNNTMGDCFEWLTSETPQEVECDKCGGTFTAWAEYSVEYVTRAKKPATTERLKAIIANSQS